MDHHFTNASLNICNKGGTSGFLEFFKVKISFEVRTVIGTRFQSRGAEMPKARFSITISTCERLRLQESAREIVFRVSVQTRQNND